MVIGRACLLALLSGAALGGCTSVGTTGGDCTSHYEKIAHARSLPALKDRLAHQVLQQGRSVKVAGRHDGKQTVNILNQRHRTVMSLDVWRRPDGIWTAQRWSQCID